ncbi:hypothetical protein PINS_up002031 [Pythium insidiosum]|nr:hypothetical protein PINS_up002031 [Pythium insidiosum]
MLSRPFSASDRRRTALVEVLVLGGEHVVTRASEPISSYVACRLTRERQRLALGAVASVNDEDSDGSVVYDLQSSPFAVTRVVERSATPLWNELLLLPVDQDDESDGSLWLVVDVVQRDVSQQEDALVATACIPLRRQPRQQPLVLEFAPMRSADAETPRMRVHLLLTAPPAETETHSGSSVCEVLVDSLSMTASTAEPAGERCLICVSPSQSAEPVSPVDLRDLFELVDGSNQSHDATGTDRTAALTPAACHREGRCRWKFPLVWYHGISSSTALRVSWFRLSRESPSVSASQLVASGSVATSDIVNDGSASTLLVPLSAGGETLGTVSLVVRLWDPQSWLRFQQLRATRRVVCTNRRDRRRAELLALEWTSALCRGLNRYPLSSFYDAGGLSSLLAEYLAASMPGAATATQGSAPVKTEESAGSDGSGDVTRMLNEHVRLLQQEVVAKQQSIAKVREASNTATLCLSVKEDWVMVAWCFISCSCTQIWKRGRMLCVSVAWSCSPHGYVPTQMSEW